MSSVLRRPGARIVAVFAAMALAMATAVLASSTARAVAGPDFDITLDSSGKVIVEATGIGPNSLVMLSVTANGLPEDEADFIPGFADGETTLVLERPISHGKWFTVSYLDDLDDEEAVFDEVASGSALLTSVSWSVAQSCSPEGQPLVEVNKAIAGQYFFMIDDGGETIHGYDQSTGGVLRNAVALLGNPDGLEAGDHVNVYWNNSYGAAQAPDFKNKVGQVTIVACAAAPAPADDDDLTDSSKGDLSVPATTPAGSAIDVTVGSAHAGAWVFLWIHSTPVALGSFVVPADGVVRGVFIPSSVPTGSHSVVAQDASGAVLGWSSITVGAGSNNVPGGATGLDEAPATTGMVAVGVLAAVMLLGMTGAAVAVRRQQSR